MKRVEPSALKRSQSANSNGEPLFQANLKGIQMVFMNMLAETDGTKLTLCI